MSRPPAWRNGEACRWFFGRRRSHEPEHLSTEMPPNGRRAIPRRAVPLRRLRVSRVSDVSLNSGSKVVVQAKVDVAALAAAVTEAASWSGPLNKSQ